MSEKRPDDYGSDRCVDCGELTINRVHHRERLSAYHAARVARITDVTHACPLCGDVHLPLTALEARQAEEETA